MPSERFQTGLHLKFVSQLMGLTRQFLSDDPSYSINTSLLRRRLA